MTSTTPASSVERDETDRASTNQVYWDLGLKLFSNGESAIIAIQTIWAAMAPPASLPLLATIVGALWADTYWAGTKFDPNLLAGNLQAALGLNPPDCQNAANTAFKQWYHAAGRAAWSGRLRLVRRGCGDEHGAGRRDVPGRRCRLRAWRGSRTRARPSRPRRTRRWRR